MHLRADMPAPKIASRGLMELRIARKIAALTGIAGPPDSSDDAGRGRAWLSDYQLLTLTEITLGGPLKDSSRPREADAGVFVRGEGRRFRHDPDIDYSPIPNATLGDYGPDTKAALVLTGVNKVLEPVAQAITEALADIRMQLDAPVLLVAVGQCLLQEVFAAQPILFLHGLQASQIQRALTLPAGIVLRPSDGERPLARAEHGWERTPATHHPMNLDIVYDLWDSVLAPVGLDRRGTHLDTERYLWPKPMSGYEQSDLVPVTGGFQLRQRLVSVIREASESLLIGSRPGAPRSSVFVDDPPDRRPHFDVTVPRQRQIELMLAEVAPQLAPRLLDEPLVKGQPLALPRINVARWRGRPLLHRYAVLLAHYYSLRAAGWISGMTKFDHRRNRDECAQRCAELVEAASVLLSGDDPLRDQLTAYALGYRHMYEATYGRTVGFYPELSQTVDRMIRRVQDRQPGRAVLIEILPLVLENLLFGRRAVTAGLLPPNGEGELTADLDRWWETTHQLRRELVRDDKERDFLNLSYVSFLLDDGCEDDRIREGLRLVTKVIANRRETARRTGRWISVSTAYLIYLRGLRIAIDRKIDDAELATWAARACEVAEELVTQEENRKFLLQRVSPARGVPSYDGVALVLLSTLAEAWISAAQSGLLDQRTQAKASRRADKAVQDLQAYLQAVQTIDPDDHSTSRPDTLRRVIAERVIKRWKPAR